MTVLRNVQFNLINQAGEQLIDESGNELIANVQLNDFEVSAYDSRMILHGYPSAGSYNTGFYSSWLTDESGNLLVDESGNELIARFVEGLRVMHANSSETTVHGG